jgi:hypothetical protein
MKVILVAKKAVDFSHDRFGTLILDADDDTIRPLEIADRRAFPQKFGIRNDREIGIRPRLANDPFDFIARANGDRGFRHDHGKSGKVRGNLAGSLIDIREIGMAIAAPRRSANGYKDRLR